MSAFLVNNATMQSAVEAFLIGADRSWKDFAEYDRGEVQSLGQELFDLNQAALADRYGDNDPAPKFRGRAFSGPRRALEGVASIQRFKSLECLIYQCSEGDVPETDLFKRMVAARDSLASKIVSSLPAYEAAGWGIREAA